MSFKLTNQNSLKKKRLFLLSFTMLLTAIVVIFSTYMSASFFSGLGAEKPSKIIFFSLGIFMELAKICAGMAVVFAFVTYDRTLRNSSLVVLVIFSTMSFISSTATISHNINSVKSLASSSSEQMRHIVKTIKDQELIVENLILMQKNDLEHNYRTRAYSFNQKIKEEQIKINKLVKARQQLQENDLSFLPVLDVFNSMIPLSHATWQKIITVILGGLTEIMSMFLLFLSYKLSNKNVVLKNNVVSVSPFFKKNKIEINKNNDLPVSIETYKNIISKIRSGSMAPTQRAFKKEIKIGNEKISRIFKQLVYDGILNKKDRAYALA